jgi:hypothetical protein
MIMSVSSNTENRAARKTLARGAAKKPSYE